MLDGFNEDAKYVVWDDVDWEHIYSPKSWFGAQKEIVVTDKYKKKQRLKWGKPSIYLCNEVPLIVETDSWYQYNVEIIRLEHRLFI